MASIPPRQVSLKNGATCTVRTAEVRDAADLITVARTGVEGPYAVTTPEEFRFTEEQEASWIEKHAAADGQLAIVADVGGRAVGLLNFENGERARIAHRGTFGITVHPDFHRLGIGRALIDALCDWARAHPVIEKVCLAVQADNTGAIALYDACGFVQEGRRVQEIKRGPDEYRDDILMYRLLRQRQG